MLNGTSTGGNGYLSPPLIVKGAEIPIVVYLEKNISPHPGSSFGLYFAHGRNPANQLSLVVSPILYKVLYIPGGAGFLPSTVVSGFFYMDHLKKTLFVWSTGLPRPSRPYKSPQPSVGVHSTLGPTKRHVVVNFELWQKKEYTLQDQPTS